jgi:hypothetical protein
MNSRALVQDRDPVTGQLSDPLFTVEHVVTVGLVYHHVGLVMPMIHRASSTLFPALPMQSIRLRI